MLLKWNVQTLYNMHINFCDIWNSNTILFRWFKVGRLNWRTSCRASLYGAAPSRCHADACGAAGGGLVNPPCQRGGPTAPLHVV
jgi:ABC-type transport system involved in Fe-S cluster assembly fused permease/ATPase subunit